MARRNTCRRCEHFTPNKYYGGFGKCDLIEDVNQTLGRVPDNTRRAFSWDYEGYSSGAYVGEDFGCIHFTRKVNQ